MSRTKYCPNCVSEMQKEKRKLGKVKEWYKCTSCGVREEAQAPMDLTGELQKEQDRRLKQKKRDERGYYDSEGYNTY